MDGTGLLLFILGIVLLAALSIYYSRRFERERSQALQAIASALGLSFDEEAKIGERFNFQSLQLFAPGLQRKKRNIMTGDRDGIAVALFDYRYMISAGNSTNTIEQSVAAFSSSTFRLPQFSLRPESVLHKVGDFFGYRDIDFDSHPDFSRYFLLRGKDEEAIRRLFDPPVLEFLEQRRGISVESNGSTLICYRYARREEPKDTEAFFAECLEIFRLFHKQ